MQSRGVRASFHVGTKGDHPDLKAMDISRVSPAEITHDLYQSLERLQTGYIDLYWLHEDDPDVPVGELLGVLNDHLSAGRVRSIGASNWTIERHRQAAAYARAHRLVGFCASQIGWSLAHANRKPQTSKHTIFMHDARLEYHKESAMPIFAWSSQASGFFAGMNERRFFRKEAALPAAPDYVVVRRNVDYCRSSTNLMPFSTCRVILTGTALT